ncbi:dTDP-4-dehydrorhamnose 3,5-epimerase [Bacillus salipaludis]|uniref:dTDP-4-dehydrorhamnose 3,5-epimerase n=1 Tax=Bacillus salipaludis TaxID=2547811 RepID=A0A4R5VQX5_9BACI|nr:dTDP-4-dehydrorhamnose 3,5-epimerase [Bacillus salipaludis]MDQ6598586.1 dTDP-4-dehydrorhamnose 3,5-epimerase [Bacillus salipaludis]TDK60864.1 dTDP-4-dehydrorhamnose 3,5-epimerase [Bacillus salipaludis]
MKVEETKLKGCYEIISNVYPDERGVFVKTFHNEIFKKFNLQTEYKEEYFSLSHKGVLRGLHFQLPPYDHDKLVYCTYGSVIDAVVDLRKGSATYGKFELFYLNSQNGKSILIPKGMAHGFYVLSEKAIMVYNVSEVYSPAHDSGIRWDSVGIPWPDQHPILSDRDRQLASFSDFITPFEYREEENNEK